MCGATTGSVPYCWVYNWAVSSATVRFTQRHQPKLVSGGRARQVSQLDHTAVAIHNATSGNIQRITYSKKTPKIRVVENNPKTVAAPRTA